MLIAVCTVGWLALSAFNLWAFLAEHKATFKTLTRGDLGHYCLMALMGPIAIAATISALCGGKFKQYWDKPVWRKP